MEPDYCVLNPLHMKVTMNLTSPAPKKNSKKRPALKTQHDQHLKTKNDQHMKNMHQQNSDYINILIT